MLQRTYQYRLYPTPIQEHNFELTSDTVRALYNMMLKDRTEHFRKTGTWKKLNAEPFVKTSLFMRDLDPSVINWTVTRLEKAYISFFHIRETQMDRYRPEALQKTEKDPSYKLMDTDLIGYPKMKTKTTKESWNIGTSHVLITPGRVQIPGVGNVKIRLHRPVPVDAQIVSYTILKKSSGHFFLQVNLQIPEPAGKLQLNNALGIALEPGKLVERSDEIPVLFRHQTKAQADRIALAYETLRRKSPGSKKYEQQRRYLASLYERQTNQRRDCLHKISTDIVKRADCIVLEEANVLRKKKRLLQEGAFEKVTDEAWWTFSQFLRYKSLDAGKRFWRAPGALPVRNSCSACGVITESTYHEKLWVCPNCGVTMSSESNAAKNLEMFAQQNMQDWNDLNRQE